MNRQLPEIKCDLLVIGAGMAGMASALFAANRKIDVVQVGMTGELSFASGLLDLLAVHPIETGTLWENPWSAIDALAKDIPGHPYALIDKQDIHRAMKDFLAFLKQCRLPYYNKKEQNIMVFTPLGTLKPTFGVPLTMLKGAEALKKMAPCVIIDFHGLKGFSGRQIVETLKSRWPLIRTHRISFPNVNGELYPERIAQALETTETRQKLAEIIRPHIGNAEYIGIPAILGIYQTQSVFDDLQSLLNRPLFEIPTMPPSITGLRLKNCFQSQLPKYGVKSFLQHQVMDIQPIQSEGFEAVIGERENEYLIHSRGVILASGRFIGKGLHADRNQIVETIFGLPVYQPPSRSKWHQKNFLDLRGHAINQAGLETDDMLRPNGKDGKRAHDLLFASGSILAHQDWIRMKCGSGLAIATAFAAIKSFHKLSP